MLYVVAALLLLVGGGLFAFRSSGAKPDVNKYLEEFEAEDKKNKMKQQQKLKQQQKVKATKKPVAEPKKEAPAPAAKAPKKEEKKKPVAPKSPEPVAAAPADMSGFEVVSGKGRKAVKKEKAAPAPTAVPAPTPAATSAPAAVVAKQTPASPAKTETKKEVKKEEKPAKKEAKPTPPSPAAKAKKEVAEEKKSKKSPRQAPAAAHSSVPSFPVGKGVITAADYEDLNAGWETKAQESAKEKALREKLTAAEATIAELNDSVANFGRRIASMQTEVGDARKVSGLLNSRTAVYEKEIANLKEALAMSEARNKKFNQEQESQLLSFRENSDQQVQAANQRAEAIRRDSEIRMTDFQRSMNDMREDHAKQVADLNAQIERMSKTESSLQTKISTLTKEAAQPKADPNLQSKVNTLTNEVETYKTQLEITKSSLQGLQRQRQEADANVAKVTATLKDSEQERTKLAGEVERLNKELAAAKEAAKTKPEAAPAPTPAAANGDEVAAITTKMENFKKMAEKNMRENMELRKQLADLQNGAANGNGKAKVAVSNGNTHEREELGRANSMTWSL